MLPTIAPTPDGASVIRNSFPIAFTFFLASVGPTLAAGETSPWTKIDKAVMGPSRPVALVYAPPLKRWMTLGYLFSPGIGPRKLTTYDDLAFDEAEQQWENWYPPGKNWGPRFGACDAPGWKGE